MTTEIFAVRDLDVTTKEFITNYAKKHKVKMAEALREIILVAKENLNSKSKKKFKSFFDNYEKAKFTADPHLSEKIDEILYGD